MPLPLNWKWYALGGTAGAALLYVLWRQQKGQSFAKAAGVAAGKGAVDLVVGTVEGVAEAAKGVLEGIVGVEPFVTVPIPYKDIGKKQTNVHGLVGRIIQPKGDDTGYYVLEVYNSSQKNLSGVKITLNQDKWGLDPITENIAVIDIPAMSGVRSTGTTLVRSLSGLAQLIARLYANGYLLDKVE